MTETEAGSRLHSVVCEILAQQYPHAIFNFVWAGGYCWFMTVLSEGKIAVQVVEMNQDHTEFLFSSPSVQLSAHESVFDHLSSLTKISIGARHEN